MDASMIVHFCYISFMIYLITLLCNMVSVEANVYEGILLAAVALFFMNIWIWSPWNDAHISLYWVGNKLCDNKAHWIVNYLSVGVSVVLVGSRMVILLYEAKIFLSLPLENLLPALHVHWEVTLKHKCEKQWEVILNYFKAIVMLFHFFWIA